MPYTAFNTLCASLPATTHVIQWGGSHIWKVGGKVFAIGGWEAAPPAGPGPAYTFKVSEIGFEMLKHAPGCRPAPYLASRGLKWIQAYGQPGLSDEDLADHIRRSHALVAAGLSKKLRAALGLA